MEMSEKDAKTDSGKSICIEKENHNGDTEFKNVKRVAGQDEAIGSNAVKLSELLNMTVDEIHNKGYTIDDATIENAFSLVVSRLIKRFKKKNVRDYEEIYQSLKKDHVDEKFVKDLNAIERIAKDDSISTIKEICKNPTEKYLSMNFSVLIMTTVVQSLENTYKSTFGKFLKDSAIPNIRMNAQFTNKLNMDMLLAYLELIDRLAGYNFKEVNDGEPNTQKNYSSLYI